MLVIGQLVEIEQINGSVIIGEITSNPLWDSGMEFRQVKINKDKITYPVSRLKARPEISEKSELTTNKKNCFLLRFRDPKISSYVRSKSHKENKSINDIILNCIKNEMPMLNTTIFFYNDQDLQEADPQHLDFDLDANINQSIILGINAYQVHRNDIIINSQKEPVRVLSCYKSKKV